jgi:hypothetical protein
MSFWDNRTAVWCECGACAITVERWPPQRDSMHLEEKGVATTCLDFWECGVRPSFRNRLRLAAGLLFKGASPTGVALDEQQVATLIAALQAPAQPIAE